MRRRAGQEDSARRGPNRCPRFREDAAKPGQGGAQMMAMLHDVDHAVFLQILRFLKALGRLFQDGLFK